MKKRRPELGLNRVFYESVFDLIQILTAYVPKFLSYVAWNYQYFVVTLSRENHIYLRSILLVLKKASLLNMRYLVDLSVVDMLYELSEGRGFRFKLIYNTFTYYRKIRAVVILFVRQDDLIPSMADEYLDANWLEREVWDMYGLFFLNHMDLRNILTDYGFVGYPLRKDFPLTGYVEVRYNDAVGDLVYEPTELAQSLRFFSFSSSWERTY